jgi:predicted  nucleic acid-binding Zn-ribbon protein
MIGRKTMDEKVVYLEKMQAQVKDWSAKIDALIVKADKAAVQKKARYQEQIRTLQAKKKIAEERLQILRTAGEGAWHDAKEAMEKISGDIRGAFDKFLHGEEDKGI